MTMTLPIRRRTASRVPRRHSTSVGSGSRIPRRIRRTLWMVCSVLFCWYWGTTPTVHALLGAQTTNRSILGSSRSSPLPTVLSATPPQPSPSPGLERQARRNLPKRPRRKGRPFPTDNNEDGTTNNNHNNRADSSSSTLSSSTFWDNPTEERRSLISWTAREAGEDYWYDLDELQRHQDEQQQQRQRRRQPQTGTLAQRTAAAATSTSSRGSTTRMPDQKLWTEILSPYKQNWIGLISVAMIALAFIVQQFPEVMNPPLIPNIPADL